MDKIESEASLSILSPSVNESMDFSQFTSSVKNSSNMYITFNKTKLIYTTQEEIWAYFSVIPIVYEMKNDDRVGISGLSSNDILVSKSISECEKDTEFTDYMEFNDEDIIAKKICFKNIDFSLLNKSLYFQFFYQTSNGNYLGKSTPFQIKESTDINFSATFENPFKSGFNGINAIERQEEDDFIVVRSQESFLKERIEHLTKSNNLLQYLIRSMEKDLSIKNKEFKDLKFEFDNCQNELSSLKKEYEDNIKSMEIQISKENNLNNSEKNEIKVSLQKEKELRMAAEKELQNLCNVYENDVKRLGQLLMDKSEVIPNSNVDKELNTKKQQSNVNYVCYPKNELLDAKSSDQSIDFYKNQIIELQNLNSKHFQEVEKQKLFYEKSKQLVLISYNLNTRLSKENEFNKSQIQRLTLINDKLNSDYIKLWSSIQLNETNIKKKGQSTLIQHPSLDMKNLEEFEQFMPLVNNNIPQNQEVSLDNVGVTQKNQETLFTSVKSLDIPNYGDKQNQEISIKKVKIPCTMCEQMIECYQKDDMAEQMNEMIEHFEKVHNQKMCPMCSILFDKRYENYFFLHVQNHFNQMKYPRKHK